MTAPGAVLGLAAVFATSGITHLMRPQVYEPIMPKMVPAHRQVILGSGIAELLCAAGLLNRSTERIAGWASVALLLGVYPANIKMAVDSLGSHSAARRAIAFGRLPLQVPMIRVAWRAAHSSYSR